MSAGIDYGMGVTNRDPETGIHFGVISANDLVQTWSDESEGDYGDPQCPECDGVVTDNFPDDWKGSNGDLFCANCQKSFWSDQCFGDQPISWNYDKDGYKATQGGDDTDIFVLKSPFYTFAKFCSPCAPGAGYLRNFDLEGVKTYCFGHDWFQDPFADGKAPYRVWRVVDDVELVIEHVEKECQNCKGTGVDTLQRIADVQETTVEAIRGDSEWIRMMVERRGLSLATGVMQCFRCYGKGTITEKEEREIHTF